MTPWPPPRRPGGHPVRAHRQRRHLDPRGCDQVLLALRGVREGGGAVPAARAARHDACGRAARTERRRRGPRARRLCLPAVHRRREGRGALFAQILLVLLPGTAQLYRSVCESIGSCCAPCLRPLSTSCLSKDPRVSRLRTPERCSPLRCEHLSVAERFQLECAEPGRVGAAHRAGLPDRPHGPLPHRHTPRAPAREWLRAPRPEACAHLSVSVRSVCFMPAVVPAQPGSGRPFVRSVLRLSM
jgi:hypothetical protein